MRLKLNFSVEKELTKLFVRQISLTNKPEHSDAEDRVERNASNYDALMFVSSHEYRVAKLFEPFFSKKFPIEQTLGVSLHKTSGKPLSKEKYLEPIMTDAFSVRREIS